MASGRRRNACLHSPVRLLVHEEKMASQAWPFCSLAGPVNRYLRVRRRQRQLGQWLRRRSNAYPRHNRRHVYDHRDGEVRFSLGVRPRDAHRELARLGQNPRELRCIFALVASSLGHRRKEAAIRLRPFVHFLFAHTKMWFQPNSSPRTPPPPPV